MAAKRNLVILGVAPREFLVRAGGSEEDVREGLRTLLPETPFEIEPVDAKTAKRLESRLSTAQLALVRRLHSEAGVKSTKGLATYRLRLAGDKTRQVIATASTTGRLKFHPSISEVKKPLGGGIGPVGVTVGVGIAGKF